MVGGFAEYNLMAWMTLIPALKGVAQIYLLLLWISLDVVRANDAGRAAMKEALLWGTAG